WEGNLCPASNCFPVPTWPRRHIICGRNPRGSVCADAGTRGTTRVVLWTALSADVSRSEHSTRRIRRRRDGRLFRRRRPRAVNRYRPGRRDDGKRHNALADAGGLLYGHVDPNADARSADLRFIAGANSGARTNTPQTAETGLTRGQRSTLSEPCFA